jgi:hypothetical protein
VFLSDETGADAWAFERNPVAPLMGVGSTTIPDERTVVDLTWPELLDEGFGPTWNELALLGVDPRVLETLSDSGEREGAFGLEFRVLRGPGIEIAWNDEHALPLRLEREVAGVVHTGRLRSLELGDAAELLRPIAELHPDWRRMDLSDWREEHHGNH